MKMKWVDIKKQLPPKNTGVLVTNGKVITAASLDYHEDCPWWWDGHGFGGYEWDFDSPIISIAVQLHTGCIFQIFQLQNKGNNYASDMQEAQRIGEERGYKEVTNGLYIHRDALKGMTVSELANMLADWVDQ